MNAARRGMSLLEVVLSVGLLAGVVSTVVGGYGAIRTLTLREQDRLNATEVAHRLILQYVSEGPTTLPPDHLVLEQGKGRYRYRLREDSLVESTRQREGMSVREAKPMLTMGANQRFQSRFLQITVSVYRDDAGGLSGEPIASLSRVFDPIDVSTQPDDLLLDHVLRMLQGQGGAGTPAPGTPQ